LSTSNQELIEGNTLYVLPEIEADRFVGVITSPPYANRYDYTRTYALELAYLGVGDRVFNLRQRQLSCTVENRTKLDELEDFYQTIDQHNRYARIIDVAQSNDVLAEINVALRTRNGLGEINNTGVLTMIDQYFTELTFVFAELYRTCRSGAHVAFVNDNVRYAGEVVPVDLLSTNLAEQVGFEPVKVYVLPQRKGNSSQQMARYGRTELRKSITVWRKP
jgi:DNA modification methylase